MPVITFPTPGLDVVKALMASGGKMPAAAVPAPKPAKAAKSTKSNAPDPLGNWARVVDGILKNSGELSLRQLGAVAQMLPAPSKPVPALDQVLGEAKATADAMYQMDIAAADSMADREEAKKYGQDATARYYERLQSLAAKQAPLSALIPGLEDQ